MGNIANEGIHRPQSDTAWYGATSRTSLSGEQYTNNGDAGIISRTASDPKFPFSLYDGGRYGYGLCGLQIQRSVSGLDILH